MLCARFTLAAVWISLLAFLHPASALDQSQNPTVRISNFHFENHQNGQGLPKDWTLKVWQGTPDVKIVREDGESILRLRSDKAAVSVYREVKLDLKRHPMLLWKWKVTKLPEKGDARESNRDDQAAGLYVFFPRFPTFVNSQLIGYIWDSNVPEGTVIQSKKNPLVHYIVVRSGGDDMNKWLIEERNVLEDYRRVFGQDPPDVGGVSVMIDSDDTRAEAESYFAHIEFNKTSASHLQPSPNRFVKFQQPELTLPK